MQQFMSYRGHREKKNSDENNTGHLQTKRKTQRQYRIDNTSFTPTLLCDHAKSSLADR